MDVTFKEITENCFTKIRQFDKLNIQNLCIEFRIRILKKMYEKINFITLST